MLLAMLLAVAGVATTHADAPDPEQLLTVEDYPQFALVRDLSAAAMVELYVSPQGRAMECQPGKVWGEGELADAMCDILRHKHLPPAHLANGAPAYSVVRGMARLFIPGTRGGDDILRLSAPADIEMMAPHLPGGAGRAELSLLLTVTPEGTVADCVPAPGERQEDLARAVCPALRPLRPGQRVGIDGAGVTYVMTLRAGLGAKDAPPPEPEPVHLPD
jgi:hypothetical protein